MATPRAAEHRDLEQRFRNIEKAVKALATAVGKRPQFTLESGDLTINGGDVLMLDTDGSILFRLGEQAEGDRGVTISRENGSKALDVARPDPILPQRVQLYDGNGVAIVAEDFRGSGFSKPRISLPMHPIVAPASYGIYGPEVACTTGWMGAFRFQTRKQNASYNPGIYVRTSDTTTGAQVRMVNPADGNVLDDFFGGDWTGDVAAGTTGWRSLTPTLNLPGGYESRIAVELQVTRNGGGGTVYVAIPESVGA